MPILKVAEVFTQQAYAREENSVVVCLTMKIQGKPRISLISGNVS